MPDRHGSCWVSDTSALEVIQDISTQIHVLRGQRVLLDADLARLYGVTTKRFNEQIKRNAAGFSDDLMFQLTVEEKAYVVANCDHLARRGRRHLPYAFTELEHEVSSHDQALAGVINAIRQRMAPPESKQRPIGFPVDIDGE